jgi:hypothetical protein
VNKDKEVNQYYLLILLFDNLLTSQRYIISCFTFKSKLSCFVAIIRVFQIPAVSTIENTVLVDGDNTLNKHLHGCILSLLFNLGQLQDKRTRGGKILHGAL